MGLALLERRRGLRGGGAPRRRRRRRRLHAEDHPSAAAAAAAGRGLLPLLASAGGSGGAVDLGQVRVLLLLLRDVEEGPLPPVLRQPARTCTACSSSGWAGQNLSKGNVFLAPRISGRKALP